MISAHIFALAPVLFAQSVSIHWIVLPVFCAFLAFEIYLYLSYRRALNLQHESLEASCRQNHLLQPGLAPVEASESWLGWVLARLRAGDFRDGRYSQDDILKRLDNWLESDGSYLLLQRIGLMSPWIGLLSTVAAFLLFEPPTVGEGDLSGIFYSLKPIPLGVAMGALLAVVNQVLLHFAGNQIAAVRTAACRWFDECVWKNFQPRPAVAAHDMADILTGMADTVRGSVEQYRGATSAISDSSRALQSATMMLVDTVERLRADTAAIPAEMQSLRSTTTDVIRSLGEIVPNVERTTSELAETATAIKVVAQEQLGQAAGRHREAADLLTSSLDEMRQSAAQWSRQFGSFGQFIEAQTSAAQQWSVSLREDMLPAQRSIHQASNQLVDATKDLVPRQRNFCEVVDSMQASVAGLAAFVRDGVDPATRRLAELDQFMARMRETIEAARQMTQLREEITGLAGSLSQVATAAEAIGRLPDAIRAVLQSVVPSRNGAAHRRPFFFGLFGRFGSRREVNRNGRG